GADLNGFGIDKLRLSLSKLSLGLVESRLKGPGINLKEELTLVDKRALLVVLLDQVARDLSPDIGINKTVERANPFAVNRNIPLFDLRHHDVRRSSRSSARRTFRTKGSY